jgi:hypothetical protein
MEEDHNCSLCPRAEEIQNYPEYPQPLENAPMAMLSCGHQVHTHCLLNRCYYGRNEETCNECGTLLVSEETIEFFRGRYDRRNMHYTENVRTLWENNEEFRKDIHEYKKIIGRLRSMSTLYSKDVKVVKNRFKQNILTSVEMIKEQKREATMNINRFASKKNYRSSLYSYTRMYSKLLRKWDISFSSLTELNNIVGAPKIPRISKYRHMRRFLPKFLFNIRI